MAIWSYTLPINFNRTVSPGQTVWGDVQYFTPPAGITITQARLYFTQNAFGGSAWLNIYFNQQPAGGFGAGGSGTALSVDDINPGQRNRISFALTASTTTQVNISNIRLELTYAGGDPDPGTLTLNKTSMAAGETVKITLGKADSNIKRTVRVYFGNESTAMYTLGTNLGSAKQTINLEYPIERCDKMPNKASGTIKIRVIPSEGSNVEKTMTITVPAEVGPGIESFEIIMDRNGVPEDIAGYVQNKSKCDYEITADDSSAYGATIAEQKVTANAITVIGATGSVGPFVTPGEVVLTATVTDTRGRMVQATQTINVLAWQTPKLMEAAAYRADETGEKDSRGNYARMISGISFSALDGDNVATLIGRVYPKGGTPPAWTGMTPDVAWVAGGGLISVDRTYVCEMRVDDLLGYAEMSFDIPTKKTPISFLAKALGIAFGKVAETPGIVDSALPVYINGKKALDESYCPKAINEVILLMADDDPAELWPGTVWDRIASGRFLVSAGEDNIGDTGGSENHYHDLGSASYAQMYPAENSIEFRFSGSRYFTANRKVAPTMTASASTKEMSNAVLLGGLTETADARPPWMAVAMWKRTA